jgi:NADP-dependent 3-hydroxy acid dehydrogenase YdfG
LINGTPLRARETINFFIQECGTVDILVSNAGIQRDAPCLEMLLENWLQGRLKSEF